MPISSTPLLDSLGPLHLLEAAQFDELRRDPATAALDPKALFQDLIRRGWVTPFQANRVLQGRGAELLLGSYVLADKLGEGGMGAVYKARSWKLGRSVALKVVRADRLGNPVVLDRFRREIRAAAQLAHANVVHAYDAGEDGGVFFFAMEIVAGADLSRLVKERGPLPVAQACDVIRQAALGLQHAHERGLVHRDVKPSNLLLSEPGEIVKVLDMGLALLCRRSDAGEDSGTLTQHGTLMGSLDYIAPEQARDSHAVDHRADLYSLGCTFYFLLTGRPPFPGGAMTAKLAAHLFEEPEPLEKVRPETPPAVADVVRKLMAKKPDDRYQTAAEVAAVLAALLHPPADGDGTTAATEPEAAPPAPASSPRPPKRRRLFIGAAVALVLLAGLVGVLVLRPRHTPPPSLPPPPAETGELALVSLDPTIRVIVHSRADPNKGGVLRPNTPVPATAGDYDLELSGDALAGLRLSKTTLTVAPGERQSVRVEGSPLTSCALVSRPAWIDGVQSWTVATRGGRGSVARLAYSPDGRWLAVAHQDGVVRLFDAAGRRLERAFMGHGNQVCALAWSPNKDKPLLASAAADGTVRVWDPASDRLGRVQPLSAAALAFAPDGKTLAIAVGNNVRLWDLADKVDEEALDCGGGIRALAWSLASGVLAAADNAGVVNLWRKTAEGWRADRRKGSINPLTTLAWSPDGKTVAAGGEDGVLRRFRADDSETLPPIPAGKAGIRCLLWSPDGKTLASSDEGVDWAIRLWDAESGTAGRVLLGQFWGVNTLAWSPSGTLASGGADHAHIWDLQKGNPTHLLDRGYDGVYNAAWSPDGTMVATDGWTCHMTLWSTSTGRPLRAGCPMQPYPEGVAWAPDNKRLTVTSWGQMQLWDLGTNQATDIAHGIGVRKAAWAPNGTVLATCSDNRVQLRDAATGQVTQNLIGHTRPVEAMAWSADGPTLATAGVDGVVILWNGATGERLRQWKHGAKVRALAWSPDGRTLASAGEDGLVRLWDREADDCIRVLKGHKGVVHAVAWTAAGKKLATIGDDATLRHWDAGTGALERTLRRGSTGGEFSPDGNLIAEGSWGFWTVRLTEAATGRPLGTNILLNQGWLVLSADGHYRCENRQVEDELVYVVQTDEGQQTLTPKEFAAKYGWKNDPEKATLDGR